MLPSVEQHPLLSAPRFLLSWPSWAAWTSPVKRPLDLRRALRAASVTDADTWSNWTLAATRLRFTSTVNPGHLPMKDGVGILIAPPLAFIDLDDAVWNAPDGSHASPEWVSRLAQTALDRGAYVEFSASGEGIHILLRTTPSFPALTRNRFTRSGGPDGPIGVEVYTHSRFCALTGRLMGPARPDLNDPEDGDSILTAFLGELNANAAPILSAPLATPISVPPPSAQVTRVTHTLADVPRLSAAFDDPQGAYAIWAKDREQASLDPSLSAWRFSLYSEASRHSPISPQPIYELFHPKGEPAHPGIPEWQQFSGYLRKPHRVYADIQRAHAITVEENRLLAVDLGEMPAKPPRTPAPESTTDEDTTSWAQLGLVLRQFQNGGTRPIPSTVNFIRIISRHPAFQQWKIERNALDGTTLVNREPMKDTFPVRLLEPLRAVLLLPTDPPLEAIRNSVEVIADDAPYDPLVEYLRSLPAPREIVDIDNPPVTALSQWLEEVGAAPSPYLKKFSRRIILGLVARALKPGIKFDTVPVFEGDEGIGKSTLIEHIVSPRFYGVHREPLDSKDAISVMRGKWGVELAEMIAFKKSDVEVQKAFFSTASDTFRPPYGRAALTVPRRTVLFGTSNDRQYLSWGSGTRRYLPVEFNGSHFINIKWFDEHRDEIFAEAVQCFEAGERYYDILEEHRERRGMMQERLITPAWQVRLIDHIRAISMPSFDDESHPESGARRVRYVADVQHTLDLPPAVQNMSEAQLAVFFHRAGWFSRDFSYRFRGSSTKIYLWLHPAYRFLSDDEAKAILVHFPELFRDNFIPPTWEIHKANLLPKALENLKLHELME